MRDARYRGPMRTTLDLDDRVLAAARARVHAGKSKSLGEAVSRLALDGLETESRGPVGVRRNGLLLLPPADHVITDEMVAEALLDE